ncbi:MAG: beta-N-acetylglucosaminidase domain-containing protein [Candidatus Puniceispirillales bacterium]
MTKTNPVTYDGYIEGYYGRLLSFADRKRLLKQIKALGMTSYFYAPKDDPYHRLAWRQPYPDQWLAEWHSFITEAGDMGITIIAGCAPGLDLDIAAETDIAIITDKLTALCSTSDDHRVIPCLLMDDIPPAMADANGQHDQEGQWHARLVGQLADRMASAEKTSMMVTPRVYADELDADTPGYLNGFVSELHPDIPVFYCGKHIVAHDLDMTATAICHAGMTADHIIVWDNIYANDYCPRQLFLGSWHGRSGARQKTGGVMLNPTGMIETDILLLNIMAAGDNQNNWQSAFREHNVPDAFFDIAHAFDRPVHPTRSEPYLPDHDTAKMLTALDELLWRWKSPLAREWYPFLMGLRGDLLMLSGQADPLRQAKILPPYLRQHYQGKNST